MGREKRGETRKEKPESRRESKDKKQKKELH